MKLWLALLRLTLQLYPTAFRAMFAAEIEAVFTLRLATAARSGIWKLTQTGLAEWFGLLGSASVEWQQTLHRSRPNPERRFIIWLLLGLSLLGALFWGRILIFHAYERHAFGGLLAALVGLIFGALWISRRAPRLSSGLLLGGGAILLSLIAGQLGAQVLVLAAIPALTLTLTLLFTHNAVPHNRHGMRLFLGITGALIFGIVWIALFPFLTVLTEIMLVPWSEASPAERPPVGTTARSVNNFFRTRPGVLIPAGITLSASLITLAAALLRAPARAELPWLWVAVGLIGLLINLSALLILPPLGFCFSGCAPISYAQRWPGILLLLVNSILLPIAPLWLSGRLRPIAPQTASETV